MIIVCPYCGIEADKPTGTVNRSRAKGAPVYCSKACSATVRRSNKTDAQKRAEKAEYHAKYRERDPERRKAEKREYYLRNIDREREREYRKSRMHLHVEYCRRPEYRQRKKQYDQQRRDRIYFGEFAEVAPVLRDLEKEILARASRYEIYMMNGTINKTQRRKREYEQSVSS